MSDYSNNWSCAADFLDDIEVDKDGKCKWTDVANAQTHIRAALRCAESSEVASLRAQLADVEGRLAANRALVKLRDRRLEAAEAQLASARKALEPFARYARQMQAVWTQRDDSVFYGIKRPGAVQITYGDFRRAAATLSDDLRGEK